MKAKYLTIYLAHIYKLHITCEYFDIIIRVKYYIVK